MATSSAIIPITIRPRMRGRKFMVELDRERMERLAASIGLFRPEFLASLECAEREVARGKARRLRSLSALRRA